MEFLFRTFSRADKQKDRDNSADVVNKAFQAELINIRSNLEAEDDELQTLVEMIFDSSFPESQNFLKNPTKDRLNAHKQTLSSLLSGLAAQGVPVTPAILNHLQKYGVDAIADTLIALLELVRPLLAFKDIPEFTSDDLLDAIDVQWHSSVRSSPAYGGSRTQSPLQSPRASVSSPRRSMSSPRSPLITSYSGMLGSPGQTQAHGLISPRKTQSLGALFKSQSEDSSLSLPESGWDGSSGTPPKRSSPSHFTATDVGRTSSLPYGEKLQPLVESEEELNQSARFSYKPQENRAASEPRGETPSRVSLMERIQPLDGKKEEEVKGLRKNAFDRNNEDRSVYLQEQRLKSIQDVRIDSSIRRDAAQDHGDENPAENKLEREVSFSSLLPSNKHELQLTEEDSHVSIASRHGEPVDPSKDGENGPLVRESVGVDSERDVSFRSYLPLSKNIEVHKLEEDDQASTASPEFEREPGDSTSEEAENGNTLGEISGDNAKSLSTSDHRRPLENNELQFTKVSVDAERTRPLGEEVEDRATTSPVMDMDTGFASNSDEEVGTLKPSDMNSQGEDRPENLDRVAPEDLSHDEELVAARSVVAKDAAKHGPVQPSQLEGDASLHTMDREDCTQEGGQEASLRASDTVSEEELLQPHEEKSVVGLTDNTLVEEVDDKGFEAPVADMEAENIKKRCEVPLRLAPFYEDTQDDLEAADCEPRSEREDQEAPRLGIAKDADEESVQPIEEMDGLGSSSGHSGDAAVGSSAASSKEVFDEDLEESKVEGHTYSPVDSERSIPLEDEWTDKGPESRVVDVEFANKIEGNGAAVLHHDKPEMVLNDSVKPEAMQISSSGGGSSGQTVQGTESEGETAEAPGDSMRPVFMVQSRSTEVPEDADEHSINIESGGVYEDGNAYLRLDSAQFAEQTEDMVDRNGNDEGLQQDKEGGNTNPGTFAGDGGCAKVAGDQTRLLSGSSEDKELTRDVGELPSRIKEEEEDEEGKESSSSDDDYDSTSFSPSSASSADDENSSSSSSSQDDEKISNNSSEDRSEDGSSVAASLKEQEAAGFDVHSTDLGEASDPMPVQADKQNAAALGLSELPPSIDGGDPISSLRKDEDGSSWVSVQPVNQEVAADNEQVLGTEDGAALFSSHIQEQEGFGGTEDVIDDSKLAAGVHMILPSGVAEKPTIPGVTESGVTPSNNEGDVSLQAAEEGVSGSAAHDSAVNERETLSPAEEEEVPAGRTDAVVSLSESENAEALLSLQSQEQEEAGVAGDVMGEAKLPGGENLLPVEAEDRSIAANDVGPEVSPSSRDVGSSSLLVQADEEEGGGVKHESDLAEGNVITAQAEEGESGLAIDSAVSSREQEDGDRILSRQFQEEEEAHTTEHAVGESKSCEGENLLPTEAIDHEVAGISSSEVSPSRNEGEKAPLSEHGGGIDALDEEYGSNVGQGEDLLPLQAEEDDVSVAEQVVGRSNSTEGEEDLLHDEAKEHAVAGITSSEVSCSDNGGEKAPPSECVNEEDVPGEQYDIKLAEGKDALPVHAEEEEAGAVEHIVEGSNLDEGEIPPGTVYSEVVSPSSDEGETSPASVEVDEEEVPGGAEHVPRLPENELPNQAEEGGPATTPDSEAPPSNNEDGESSYPVSSPQQQESGVIEHAIAVSKIPVEMEVAGNRGPEVSPSTAEDDKLSCSRQADDQGVLGDGQQNSKATEIEDLLPVLPENEVASVNTHAVSSKLGEAEHSLPAQAEEEENSDTRDPAKSSSMKEEDVPSFSPSAQLRNQEGDCHSEDFEQHEPGLIEEAGMALEESASPLEAQDRNTGVPSQIEPEAGTSDSAGESMLPVQSGHFEVDDDDGGAGGSDHQEGQESVIESIPPMLVENQHPETLAQVEGQPAVVDSRHGQERPDVDHPPVTSHSIDEGNNRRSLDGPEPVEVEANAAHLQNTEIDTADQVPRSSNMQEFEQEDERNDLEGADMEESDASQDTSHCGSEQVVKDTEMNLFEGTPNGREEAQSSDGTKSQFLEDSGAEAREKAELLTALDAQAPVAAKQKGTPSDNEKVGDVDQQTIQTNGSKNMENLVPAPHSEELSKERQETIDSHEARKEEKGAHKLRDFSVPSSEETTQPQPKVPQSRVKHSENGADIPYGSFTGPLHHRSFKDAQGRLQRASTAPGSASRPVGSGPTGVPKCSSTSSGVEVGNKKEDKGHRHECDRQRGEKERGWRLPRFPAAQVSDVGANGRSSPAHPAKAGDEFKSNLTPTQLSSFALPPASSKHSPERSYQPGGKYTRQRPRWNFCTKLCCCCSCTSPMTK